MTTKFDPTKPVQTRDGRKARILTTDLRDTRYPIVAALHRDRHTKVEYATTFTKSGRNLSGIDSSNDLVNVSVGNP